MITLEILQRIWQIIESQGSVGVFQIEARQIDMVTTPEGPPLLTIDLNLKRHLLIPIASTLVMKEDKQSAGVHILINEWGNAGRKQRYIDTVCLMPHLNGLFDLVIFDILHALTLDSSRPEKTCGDVLNRWRELLNRDAGGFPDKTTLTGLFGELSILHDLAILDPKSLNLWVGPTGARYDFYSGHIAVEVKSSTQRIGRIVTIHGHDQLEKPGGGELFLVVQKLEEVPFGGQTIIDIIQHLVELGCDRSNLYILLANGGLVPESIEKCDNLHFRIIERCVYAVDDRFPCITLRSFTDNKLPDKVISISYQLDLSSQPPYPLVDEEVSKLFQRLVRELA